MEPERAIKILNYFIETGVMQPEPSFTNAIKLGIEALRRDTEREITPLPSEGKALSAGGSLQVNAF